MSRISARSSRSAVSRSVALALELLDVRDRLVVLGLRERVDRARAARAGARAARSAPRSAAGRLVVERLLGGLADSPSRSARPRSSSDGVGLLVARLLRADLADGDRLAALAQALLDLGLLGRAGAQRRGDALARRAVRRELGLEHLDPRRDGRAARAPAPRPAARRPGAAPRSRASAASSRAIRAARSARSRAARSAHARSAASSPRSWARRTAASPCSGALRRSSMSHAARRSSSAAPRALALGLAQRALGGRRGSRPPRARRAAPASTASSAARSAATARSDSRTSSSRRLRSASTRSVPPCGAWRSSRVKPNHARPRARHRDAGEARRQLLDVLDDPRVREQPPRERDGALAGPRTSSARHRAPGAGGDVERGRARRAVARDQRAAAVRPARSSTARPAGTSSTTAAPSRPPSAAASASS